MAGHFTRRLDDLAHSKAFAGTKVEVTATLGQRRQRQHMRPSQVADMNVITDAGSVARVVVGTKYFDVRALTSRHLQDQWNEVDLWLVILAVLGCRTAGVEVAQASRTDTV